ncbi:HAD-IIB family hydrolase [Variovorax paradoxus]|nr:HAD-IIB family hydrolase [Variovorax paradoxus]
MLPLHTWPAEDRRRIVGVLTDIDDTLTTEGAITPDALQALHGLKAAGLPVIAITGRSVGWSEPFAPVWPVDAIVAENGAVALVASPSGRLEKRYRQDVATRAAHLARMQQALVRVEREVPGARRATDSPGRETDIAIDHSEFAHLGEAQIAQAVQIMRAEGMNATVSSIHVNGWFGDHNKWVGACWIVRELFGRELASELDRWVYVGDSTNDVLMFERFPHSVGVANIRRFEAKLSALPRYISAGERGAGFAEVAAAVLQGRAGGERIKAR